MIKDNVNNKTIFLYYMLCTLKEHYINSLKFVSCARARWWREHLNKFTLLKWTAELELAHLANSSQIATNLQESQWIKALHLSESSEKHRLIWFKWQWQCGLGRNTADRTIESTILRSYLWPYYFKRKVKNYRWTIHKYLSAKDSTKLCEN